MIKSFNRSAAAALCCLLLPFAGSACAAENYDLFKYGSQSCDEWIRHSDLTEDETPKWFQGLLVGLFQGGGYRIDFLNEIKPDETKTWLSEYCRAHPLDGLAVAGTVLTNELAARAAIKKQ
jgi:hypothetical protein